MLKTYHHRKEKSYRGSRDSFGNGMTRGTTWEGVQYLIVTKVKISIALMEGLFPRSIHRPVLCEAYPEADLFL